MTSLSRSLLGRSLTTVGGLALALSLTGCLSSEKTEELNLDVHWIEPSPVLEDQIDDVIRQLPWSRGFERIEQIRWLASVGEPAYSHLLDLAIDPRDDVSAAALAALGATLDRRLVDPIKALEWTPAREASDLGLERARTLVRLGDWSPIPTLIDGLGDDRVYTRTLCIEALFEATRHDLDFDPHAGPEQRLAAQQRWQGWWATRNGDELLIQGDK